jgi:hypothetical protein
MSYAQPSYDLTLDPPAAKLLDTLMRSVALGEDPDDVRTTWLGVYPDLPAQFERALALQGKRDAEDMADVIQRHINADDHRSQIEDALQAHRKAKLTDPKRMAELAAEFEEDVVTSDTLDQIEMPDPLVEGLLTKQSLARIYGPSKSLKSFVGLDLAGCIAGGIDWHGVKVHKAKTLYVVAEGVGGTLQRVKAWERQYGRKYEGDLYKRAVQIADQKEMARLVAFATLNGHEFIVFDTQARCTVGIDEDRAKEMGVVIDALDVLKESTGACAMLVHHSGLEGGRARGSTSVFGAMDSEFEVKREKDSLNLEFITRKVKDEGEEESIRLTAVKHTNISTPKGLRSSLALASGYVSAGRSYGVQVATPTLTGLQADVLVALARYDGIGPSQVAKDVSRKKESVHQDFTALKRMGCVAGSKYDYKITDFGWSTLENMELTTAYHTVAPMEEPLGGLSDAA